jgi:hypothetical protein
MYDGFIGGGLACGEGWTCTIIPHLMLYEVHGGVFPPIYRLHLSGIFPPLFSLLSTNSRGTYSMYVRVKGRSAFPQQSRLVARQFFSHQCLASRVEKARTVVAPFPFMLTPIRQRSNCQHTWRLRISRRTNGCSSTPGGVKCRANRDAHINPRMNWSSPSSNNSFSTPSPPLCSTGDRGFLTTVMGGKSVSPVSSARSL